MKKLILVLDDLGIEADHMLQESEFEISRNISSLPDAAALIVRSSKVTKEMILQASKLKVISRAGVGIDTIDSETAKTQGIIVCNSKGGNSVNAAETTMSFILSLAHKTTYAHYLLYGQKTWERGSSTEGFELENKTLGIIGFGDVGSRVARFAQAFGMKILIYDPYITEHPPEFIRISNLNELLPQCRFITLHTPLTKETEFMIAEPEFALMNPDSYLINASRGKVVKESALINALKTKQIKGAALDVFETEPLPQNSELFDYNNVILIPHLGGAGIECRARVSCLAVENVFRILKD